MRLLSNYVLEAYAENPDSANSHAVGYHVRAAVWHFDPAPQERGCPRCRQHLEFLAGEAF